MNLVVIADSKFEKVFDEVLPEKDYFVAKISGKECAFLNRNYDFATNLEIVKSIGASKVLEITNDCLDDSRADIAESFGIMYSGFSVSGEDEYVKSLIEIAVFNEVSVKNSGLTDRECEVLGLVGKGMSNKDIAKELFLSEKTVKNHLNSIFKKIDVADRTNAALYAVRNNI